MDRAKSDYSSNHENSLHESEDGVKPAETETEEAFEKQSEKPAHTTRVYNRVPNNVRKELVDRVYKSGESIYEAAIQLGIKYSTAKTIVKIYRQEGRIDKMDPNECKKSNARKRRGKVSSKWIKKTNTDSRSENPRKEGEKTKQKEAIRPRRQKPNTRLTSGKIARPQYFSGQEEAELIQDEVLADCGEAKLVPSEKRQLRSAKREHENDLPELKAQPRKICKTLRSSEIKITREDRKDLQATNESKIITKIEFEKAEVKTTVSTQPKSEKPNSDQEAMKMTDESMMKTINESVEEIVSKNHSTASNASIPFGSLPSDGLFLPRHLDPARELPFQLPFGVPTLGGLYNPMTQLLLAKNLQMQNMLALSAGQPHIRNQALSNLLRMGAIPGINLPLNLQLMSLPSHSKSFFDTLLFQQK